ncbi:hypothetical protein DMENIID0001_157360 [Sergentomyia squamirostris]
MYQEVVNTKLRELIVKAKIIFLQQIKLPDNKCMKSMLSGRFVTTVRTIHAKLRVHRQITRRVAGLGESRDFWRETTTRRVLRKGRDDDMGLEGSIGLMNMDVSSEFTTPGGTRGHGCGSVAESLELELHSPQPEP